MIAQDKEGDLMPATMTRMADFLVESHVEVMESSFLSKYKKNLVPRATEYSPRMNEALPIVADPVPAKQEPVREQIQLKPKSVVVNNEAIREALVKFRLEQSRRENIKPYFIYNNKQMEGLIEAMPTCLDAITKCDGFGESKVKKYGEQILSIFAASRSE